METTDGPWARPIGLPPADTAPHVGAEAADIPWIDVHQHTQSLTWDDREAFDIAGCRAAVMIAAAYFWTPYRPIQASDVRFLWDDALRRAAMFDHKHFFDSYVAVGIHTSARVEGVDELIDVLPGYAEHDAVVAIGETGFTSSQQTSAWGLEAQAAAIREQFHVARETGLPVFVHTPGSSRADLPAWKADRFEEVAGSFTDSVLDPKTAKVDAIERTIELVAETGLPPDQVVIDHAEPEIAPQVLETTDCHLAFSIAAPWLRGLDAAALAAVIDEYGPDRILLDTDLAGPVQGDPYVMRRMILDLLREGVDPADVRQVVYENAQDLLDLDG